MCIRDSGQGATQAVDVVGEVSQLGLLRNDDRGVVVAVGDPVRGAAEAPQRTDQPPGGKNPEDRRDCCANQRPDQQGLIHCRRELLPQTGILALSLIHI